MNNIAVPATEWLYEKTVAAERQLRLNLPSSFDELVALAVVDIAEIRPPFLEPGQDLELRHCYRPVFCFKLKTVGDSLFNGRSGYRAQYWRDPIEGLRANTKLISALTPKLLAELALVTDKTFKKINVCSSLRALSAKFWFREASQSMGITAGVESNAIDLRVEPWYREARRGVRLAQLGVRAPETVDFAIKGAFVDARGNEVVPHAKISRHFDIHHYGYS